MKAFLTEEANLNQAAAKSPSKTTHGTKADGMYARLRRLEQRLQNIEASITIIRRDVFRIEKKQRKEETPSHNTQSVDLSALFR